MAEIEVDIKAQDWYIEAKRKLDFQAGVHKDDVYVRYSAYRGCLVGRRKLVHDTIRHGRFTIIVEQRKNSLYKAKTKDALFGILIFSYSVQDTMTVLHFWHLLMR